MVFKMCEGISCSLFSVKELDVIAHQKIVSLYIGGGLTALLICAAYSSWFPGGKWSLRTPGWEPGW